ncbi:MAG: hypothetical protein AAGD96_03335 [Chloroflexota bacterium]
MNGWILLVVASLILTACGTAVLHRFRQRGAAEKRRLDLKILAHESGAQFYESDQTLNQILLASGAAYRKRAAVVKNLISRQHPHGRSVIFDYAYYTEKKKTLAFEMTGVHIEFHAHHFPKFKIITHPHAGWFRFPELRRMSKIPPKELPSWLPSSCSVLINDGDDQSALHFIEQNKVLQKIIMRPDFEGLFFFENTATCYFKSRYPADVFGHARIMQPVNNLLRLETAKPQKSIT